MSNDKSFFENRFFLFIYLFFLALDCYFLKTAHYGSRMFSKPILMLALLFWFFKRTSFARKSVIPNSYWIIFYTYSVLILSFLSDICALWSDVFVWSVCRLLYIPIYLLYILLLIEVQKREQNEHKIIFSWYIIIPTFIIFIVLASVVLWKAVGFGTAFYHYCLYIHSFIICILSVLVANMWREKNVGSKVLLFTTAVFFIILTNITFCFDELYYNRRHHSLDVFVAIGNGLATLLMLFGVMRVLKDWRKG